MEAIFTGSAPTNSSQTAVETGSSKSNAGGNTASFERLLSRFLDSSQGQTIEAQQTDVSFAAIGLAAFPPITMPIPELDAAIEVIEHMLSIIESEGTDDVRNLANYPSLTQWLDDARRILGLSIARQEASNQPERLVEESDLSMNAPSTSNTRQINDTAVMGLNETLKQLLSMLRQPSIPTEIAQLARDFAQVASDLIEQLPGERGTAKTGNDQLSVRRMDVLIDSLRSDTTEKIVPVRMESADLSRNASQDSASDSHALLQRLSYSRPSISLTLQSWTTGDHADIAEQSSGEKLTMSTQEWVAPVPTTQSQNASPVAEGARSAYVMHARNMVADMSQLMVRQMSITHHGGIQEARISLVPEHLGHLDLKITMHNGQITAHFLAETAGARDLLESSLPALRTALQQQGLTVDKLVVSHNQGFQSGTFQEHRQHRSQQSSSGNNKSEISGLDAFEQEIVGQTEQTIMRYHMNELGSSFHASA